MDLLVIFTSVRYTQNNDSIFLFFFASNGSPDPIFHFVFPCVPNR